MAVEEKQAVVLEQPKDQKVYLDVQHSTDTTAIWSFIIALVVAFILGISATIIAIWYGRKSFQLTEMSFKTVVEQIKASEQSALDLNIKLFEQQITLRNLDKKLEIEKNIIERFRFSASNFIMQADAFLSHITLLHLRYVDHTFNEKVEMNSYESEIFKNIQIKFDNLLNSRSSLLFSALEMDASTHDEIDLMTSKVINSLTLLQNRLLREREKILEDIEKSKNMIFKSKIKLYSILKK